MWRVAGGVVTVCLVTNDGEDVYCAVLVCVWRLRGVLTAKVLGESMG